LRLEQNISQIVVCGIIQQYILAVGLKPYFDVHLYMSLYPGDIIEFYIHIISLLRGVEYGKKNSDNPKSFNPLLYLDSSFLLIIGWFQSKFKPQWKTLTGSP